MIRRACAGGIAAYLSLALSGCSSAPPAGRIHWERLPQLQTETTVFFDRGHASRTEGGYRVYLYSDRGAPSRVGSSSAVFRTLSLDVPRGPKPAHPPALVYEMRSARLRRVYRSISTSQSSLSQTDGRVSGSLKAKLSENLYGTDYEGGDVDLTFDVPIE